MSKNKQRTGIFDLAKNEHDEPFIIAPSIVVDVNSVRLKGNRISAHSALMIVKEQMRLSGEIGTIGFYLYSWLKHKHDIFRNGYDVLTRN
ncbi:hypothetical protein [Lysinibacillus sp. NPDC047702]|uniref:hypothetical protein n=1 Tax=unclassified Lysinibacillus TaxID=2636778 RepID=UPI003D00219C